MTFDELYLELLKSELIKTPPKLLEYNEEHLKCLLSPKDYPPVIKLCECKDNDCSSGCISACIFNAIEIKNGMITINKELCTGCQKCINACKEKKIVPSLEAVAAIKAVNNAPLSFAVVAPSFMGQFKNCSAGSLRSAFKKLGFTGMVEVALFADILTLKEALEFKNNIKSNNDYMLTSCCCPVWISLIKNKYPSLLNHLAPNVSPMIACGRVIKALHKNAITVFIGPCLAKKAEAKEKDLQGAIDYVLTFKEISDCFSICNIDPNYEKEELKDHSSTSGRIYAVSGGVSQAVKSTVKKLEYKNKIPVKTKKAEGITALKEMLESIDTNKSNFFEGMGCIGGCVGGPKAIIDKDLGATYAKQYANLSPYKTPLDNPFCMLLLKKLQINSEEELLKSSLFKRNIFTK